MICQDPETDLAPLALAAAGGHHTCVAALLAKRSLQWVGEEVNIRIHDHSDIHFNDSLHVHSIVLCIAVFLGLTIMQLCSL